MNQFLNTMKTNTNIGYTENGAIKRNTTLNGLLDLFALGGAYRERTDEDCITLFSKALKEDESLALKCLFYLRDILKGQGERRFFRVIMHWLAYKHPDMARRNLQYVPEYGRWDDLYTFVGTPLEKDAFNFMQHQLALDLGCSKTPSLLAKWLKSENTSSEESRQLAKKTRQAFAMTSRQYRKVLSTLRERIRIVERLMSQNRWDEIEFDKLPSRAGIIYRNAFARRDILKERYEAFAKNKETKVNAAALYPHDIAARAFRCNADMESPERLMLQKYWDNLPNYYGDNIENGIAVVDTSGSMIGTPMEAAVSLGAYIAEKAHGPFANHFITFSSRPELIEFEGVDIVDKFNRCCRASWGMNTNIEAVFDLLLNTALKDDVSMEDIPNRIYVFSDMEFDGCVTDNSCPSSSWYYANQCLNQGKIDTLLERIAKKWASHGFKMPSVVFWNLNARSQNIPAIGPGFSYVSGFSPVMIEQILSGKDGLDLALAKLNSERYAVIE